MSRALPKAAQDLPIRARDIFRTALDAAHEKYGEERAIMMAWAAVKSKYKKDGNRWVDSETNAIPFSELLTLDAGAKMRETSDGYLVASPRIARIGIQVYDGWEVGRPELKQVKVYRPEDEVFHADSVSSYAFKPVTNEHPGELVDVDNWSDLAVGHLGGDVMRDGDFMRMSLIVMDKESVVDVKDGKRELSAGYTAILEWGDGKSPQGEEYHATQRQIRANHVAITDTARGGSKLRMGDDKREEKKRMATRTFMVDGISVEMEEKDVQIVERHINKLEEDLEEAGEKLVAAQAAAQTELATAKTETANVNSQVQTKDAEIATLKKQLEDSVMTPQKLDRMVQDRVATVGKAKSILGDKLVIDGKTDVDIRRQVVSAKLGDTAKDWNDDMVTASFNTLTAGVVADSGNLRQVAQVISLNQDAGNSNAAYAEYEKDLTNRWKTAGARNK